MNNYCHYLLNTIQIAKEIILKHKKKRGKKQWKTIKVKTCKWHW